MVFEYLIVTPILLPWTLLLIPELSSFLNKSGPTTPLRLTACARARVRSCACEGAGKMITMEHDCRANG